MDKAAEPAAKADELIQIADQLLIAQGKIDKYASNAAGEQHFLLEPRITELHEAARELLLRLKFAPTTE